MSTSMLARREVSPVASSTETYAIQVSALGKTYDVRPVLRHLAFQLPRGRTLALLGQNGAGKTTLLRILATLARPSAGLAIVEGLDVRKDAADVRRILGYVGHQPHLYDELTARENLLFFARMYGLRDGAKRSDTLLERVGLRLKANDRVSTLSRGQSQRLALARGILHDPAVLLLDEPDTGLDDDATSLLDELLTERSVAATTTIFTTHNIARGLERSTDTLVLTSGRVAHCGPSRELTVADVRELYGRRAR